MPYAPLSFEGKPEFGRHYRSSLLSLLPLPVMSQAPQERGLQAKMVLCDALTHPDLGQPLPLLASIQPGTAYRHYRASLARGKGAR
jgi:hypothetical protein